MYPIKNLYLYQDHLVFLLQPVDKVNLMSINWSYKLANTMIVKV